MGNDQPATSLERAKGIQSRLAASYARQSRFADAPVSASMAANAVLAVTLQPADAGDTTTVFETLRAAQAGVEGVGRERIKEVVADKGYHSNGVLVQLKEEDVRSYVSEPERGRRRWQGKADAQKAVYGNRRRLRGERSKRLQRKRGELTERIFAHMYETGGMRRLHLRGRRNILKRLLVHGAGFDLSLLMRKCLGAGKPRQLQGRVGPLFAALSRLRRAFRACTASTAHLYAIIASPVGHRAPSPLLFTPSTVPS